MQTIRPRADSSKINELSRKAGEHLGVVHHGVEIVHSLQLSGQMESNFELTRLDLRGRVPCSTARTIKSVEFARPKVRKGSVDEVGVRQTAYQFASVKGFCPLLLSRQAPAGCTFNFGEIGLVSLAYELQQHGIAQAGG
jgi:hypothetical protein